MDTCPWPVARSLARNYVSPMRITRGYRSDNVEDRRGQSGPGGGGFSAAGVGMLAFLFRRFGIVGVLIGLGVMYFAGNLGSGGGSDGLGASGNRDSAAAASEMQAEQPMVELVSFVFDDSQNTWRELFARDGRAYRNARLVLFRGSTRSACGTGQAEMGPFYCPRDEKVYIDLGFYERAARALRRARRFRAGLRDRARGRPSRADAARRESARARSTALASRPAKTALVRLELQADCYAGVWAHSTQRRDLLEVGDSKRR